MASQSIPKSSSPPNKHPTYVVIRVKNNLIDGRFFKIHHHSGCNTTHIVVSFFAYRFIISIQSVAFVPIKSWSKRHTVASQSIPKLSSPPNKHPTYVVFRIEDDHTGSDSILFIIILVLHSNLRRYNVLRVPFHWSHLTCSIRAQDDDRQRRIKSQSYISDVDTSVCIWMTSFILYTLLLQTCCTLYFIAHTYSVSGCATLRRGLQNSVYRDWRWISAVVAFWLNVTVVWVIFASSSQGPSFSQVSCRVAKASLLPKCFAPQEPKVCRVQASAKCLSE